MEYDINYNFIDKFMDHTIRISKLYSDRSVSLDCNLFSINNVKDNQVLFTRLREESTFFDFHFKMQYNSITCKEP